MLSAQACGDAPSALALIERIMTEVEEEFSGVPNDPAKYRSDGRLYPPQADAVRGVPGRPDLRRYRSVGHNTFIGLDGAIFIQGIEGTCLLDKPARSGATITLW
jgi:hypothetical protein